MNTNMTGFDRFSKIDASLCFGRKKLSTGRVKQVFCPNITALDDPRLVLSVTKLFNTNRQEVYRQEGKSCQSIMPN